MTVVIVGSSEDPHARAVEQGVRRRGADVRLFDTYRFPGDVRVSLGGDDLDITIDGQRTIPTAVYIRDLGLEPTSSASAMTADWRKASAALRERAELVLAIVHRWEVLGIAMYNPLTAFQRITKPFQLALLKRAGLPVPESLWTNDPDEVARFAEHRRVAYKPVAGGAHTKELEPRDVPRLPLLANAPVCFQELLPGRDVRVYVIDGTVTCALEITTSTLDFRQDEQAVTQLEPDPELRAICVRAAQTLGLRFTGIDLKADATGALKILELNPSPMFLGFDRKSGSDILGALCAALVTT